MPLQGREGEIELRFEGTGETLTVTFVRSTSDDGLAGTQATLQAVHGDLKALAGCPELR
ncbi:hypothetical protein [Salinibacter ruber]|uniref:hypothetical protein n=1 Tax=Salinibacter ruber TaxID=146919 RepID=UPI002168FACF|nr:hypothetical protein [Salinibacter ruber]MCS4039279.1 hypothetical protein [Salinibacter ruber]